MPGSRAGHPVKLSGYHLYLHICDIIMGRLFPGRPKFICSRKGRSSMTANYHTHTWRCMHAEGTEREYVEHAIQCGLKILGFSDHAPMPYPAGYTSRVRMRMDQLEDYISTVLALKEEYKNEIEIHIGLESEYYPAWFEPFLRVMEQYPIEYLLLGQHFLGNEIGEPYAGRMTDDPALLERYCRQSCEALKTGCFTYFAHPDLIYFTGDARLYEEWMRRLCRCAREEGVPLELNLLGIREGRNYPNPAFWKIAAQEGGQVIFGADAHEPDKVSDPDSMPEAQAMLQGSGLTLLETAELRRPTLARLAKAKQQGKI